MENIYFAYQQQQKKINAKYKAKNSRLQKIIKNLVFENAAMCDHVAQIQENILCVKEERRFLLKKLLEHDPELLIEPVKQSANNVSPDGTATASASKPKKSSKKRSNSEASNKSNLNNVPKVAKTPKNPKKQIIQTIAVDQMGQPVYPIIMGNLTIYDLGDIIIDRPGYHTDHWIYPIGFVSTRIYAHIKEPDRKCLYTCKINDYGDSPRFEIIPDSDMDYAIAGPSADLCHAALLQTINTNSGGRRHMDVNPQGEYFFGLGHPTVMTLIQTSVKAKKCLNFKSFKNDNLCLDLDNDPTINYEALQKYFSMSVYHTVPEIKEEPPDELLEQSDGTSCSFSLP